MRCLSALALLTTCLTGAIAQVPEGYYAWCSFQSSRRGQTGVFFSHPRNPGAPIVVTGLTADLKWDQVNAVNQGASCLLRRPSDGVLIVGERAPQDHSVDLHFLTLVGSAVYRDVLYSVGTSNGSGEIPQTSLLPDGRVLVAATGLSSGPLALYNTVAYGMEGVGILDPVSGRLTPVPITNGAKLPGVYNGMVASPDGKTCYLGTWVSGTQGDVWAIPLPGGGTATKVASVNAGLSNLAIDVDGKLLIATLNGPPNLYKVDLGNNKVEAIKTANGPLNAIAVETVSGNYAIASANSGIPFRSVFWMERGGKEHLLTSPDKATISGIDINPNPEAYGPATAGPLNSYAWALSPNPGGLPTTGNSNFSLTLDAERGIGLPGVFLVSLARLIKPITALGVQVCIDPTQILVTGVVMPAKRMTIPMPLPADTSLAGIELYFQTLHLEGNAFAASSGLAVTIL